MGWDCCALDAGEHLAQFEAAARCVVEDCGDVDSLLREGRLHTSACAAATDSIIPEEAWDDFEDSIELSPETVKHLFKSADWPTDCNDEWDIQSVFAFWKTCSELGLGIYISI